MSILHAKLKNIKYLILVIWLILLALAVLVRGLPRAEGLTQPAAGEAVYVSVYANGRLDRILEL